ncbi:hypothetical protein TGME49_217860 [Toxoplasma gondii ME49]|uniref:Uncharacterized protein n=2 Tax=Toxoplasma gondii TaxID=5811 RepID=B6KU30_TOXGV|nr:hypothetical protein TGME49_217860 [Toxoplasma gondii ME49]EPT24770.1 hypothetical protein TGME49_217860 [Toxoplasma gondii ME49]ESS34069.1 hypothetical protein TGVEG_217860 [Toxoplasma gondii VEG]CEL78250.1 TPA: hypothetical protein BN1205_006550 [Toxoplasma gondii VEG]|eukprot:XP_002371353.1 hypothetical protein TGME49_217860 [Toxoplasma gondii ME49]
MAKRQKGLLRQSPSRTIRNGVGETGSRPESGPASLAHRAALECNAFHKKSLQRSPASIPSGTSSPVPQLYASAQAADVVKPCEHPQLSAAASSEEQAAVQLVQQTPRRTRENERSEDATREAKGSASLAVYSPRVSFCDAAGPFADLLKGSSGTETQDPPNSPDLHMCTDCSGVLSAASQQTADSDASNADRSELSKFDLTPRATYQSSATQQAGLLDTRSQEARVFCMMNSPHNAKSAAGRTQQSPSAAPSSPALLPTAPLSVPQRDVSDRRLALQTHLATLERRLTDFLGIVAAAAPGAMGAAIGVAAAGPPANPSMSCTSAAKGASFQGSSTRQKSVGPCRMAVQKTPLWGSVEATLASSAGRCGGIWWLGREERPSSPRSREADQLGDTPPKSEETGERASTQNGDTRLPEGETARRVPTHSLTENSGSPLSDALEAKVRRLTEVSSRIHQHPGNAHSPTGYVQGAGQVPLARGLLSIDVGATSCRSSQSVSSLASETSDVSGEPRTSRQTAVSPMSAIVLRDPEETERAVTSPASGPSPWQRRAGGAHRLRNGRKRSGESDEALSASRDRGMTSRSSAQSIAGVQKVALNPSGGDAFFESSDLNTGGSGSRGVASGGAAGDGGNAADRERRTKSPESREGAADISNACAQTTGSMGMQELSHESLSGFACLSGADCTPALSCCSVSACSGFGHGSASTPVSPEKPTDWTATPSTAVTCTPEMTASSQLSLETTQRVPLRLPPSERERSFDRKVNEKALQTPGKEAKQPEGRQLVSGAPLAATRGEDWSFPSDKRLLERRDLPGEAALFPHVPTSGESRLAPAASSPDAASRHPVGSAAVLRGACRLRRSEPRDRFPHKEKKGPYAPSCEQASLQARAEQLSRPDTGEGIPNQLLQHLLLVLQCLDQVKNMQAALHVCVAPPAEVRGLEAPSGALDTAEVCLPSTAALLSATAALTDEVDLVGHRWRERGRLVADVALKSTHAAAMAGALAALPSSEEAPKRRGAFRRQAPRDQADAFDRLSAAVLAVTEAAADAAACAAHETEDDRETELLKRGPPANRLEKRPSSRPFRESGWGCRTQLPKEKLRFFRRFSTPGGRSRHATRSSACAKEGRHLEDARDRQRRRKRMVQQSRLDGEREKPWRTQREAAGCLRSSGDAASSESEPGANGVNEKKSDADGRRCLGFSSRLSLEPELRRREDSQRLKEARERKQNGALSLLQGSWVIRLLPPASPERKVEQRGCAAAARSAAANFFLSFAGGRRGRETASRQEPEAEASSSFASRLFPARRKASGSDRARQLPRQEKCFLFVSADFSHLCCAASPPPSVVRATEGSRAAGDLRRAVCTTTETACSLGGAATSNVSRKDSRELCAGEGSRGKDAARRQATPAADACLFCQGSRRTQALSNGDGTEASTAKSERHADDWTLAEETVDHGFGATSGSENGESIVGGSPSSSQKKPGSDLPFQGVQTPGSNWESEGCGGTGADELLASPCRSQPRLHVALPETKGVHAVSPLEESRAGDMLAPGISSQSLEAKTCSPTRLGADRTVPCCDRPSAAATRVRISEGEGGSTVLGFCCLSDSSVAGSRMSRTSAQRITPVVASPCCAWEERTPESECSLCGDMTASTVSALTPDYRRTPCQQTESLDRAGCTSQLKASGSAVVAFSDGQGGDSEGADTDASVAPSVLCVALPAFASCQRRRQGRANRKACLSSASSPTTGEPRHAAREARRPRKETSLQTACVKRSASKSFFNACSGSDSGGRRDQRDKVLNPLDRRSEPRRPSWAVATSSESSGKTSRRLETASRQQAVGARGSPLGVAPSQFPWKSPQLIVPLSAVESVEYGYSSSAYHRLQRSNCAPLVAVPPYLCCSIRVRRNRDQTQEGSERGNLTDCSSAASVASCWSACTPQAKPESRRWGTEGGKTPRTGLTREDDLEAFDFIVLSESDAAKWAVSLNSLIRHDPRRVRFTAEEFSYQLHVMRQHHTQRLRLECLLAHTQLHARRGPEARSESGSKRRCERREPADSAHSSASRAADLEALAGIQDFTTAISGWQEVHRNASSALKIGNVRSRSDRDSDFVVESSLLGGKILEGETLESEASESEASESDTDASWRDASCESSRRYDFRQGARRPRRRCGPYRFSSAPPQICGCSCCSTTTGSGADLNSGDEYVRLRSWAPSALSRLPSSLRGPSSRRGRTPGDPRMTRPRVAPKAGDTPTRGATFSRALKSTEAEGDGSQSRACASVGEANVVDDCAGRQGCSRPRSVGIRTAAVSSPSLPAPKTSEEQGAPGGCGFGLAGTEQEENTLPDASEPPKNAESREEKANQNTQTPSTSTAQVGPVRGQSPLRRGMSDVTPGALGVKRSSGVSRSLPTPALANCPSKSLVGGRPELVPNSVLGREPAALLRANSSVSGQSLPDEQERFESKAMRSLWRSRSYAAPAASAEMRRWASAGVSSVSNCGSQSGRGTPASKASTTEALLRFLNRSWKASRRKEARVSHTQSEHRGTEGLVSGEQSPPCMGPSRGGPPSGPATQSCLCRLPPPALLPGDKLDASRSVQRDTEKAEFFSPVVVGSHPPFYLNAVRSYVSGLLSPPHITQGATWVVPGPLECGGCAAPVRMHQRHQNQRLVESRGSACEALEVIPGLSVEPQGEGEARVSRGGLSSSVPLAPSGAQSEAKRWRSLTRGFGLFARRRPSEEATQAAAGRPVLKRSASCFTAGDRHASCMRFTEASAFPWSLRPTVEPASQTPAAGSCRSCSATRSLPQGDADELHCMQSVGDEKEQLESAAPEASFPLGIFVPSFPPVFGGRPCCLHPTHQGGRACNWRRDWAGCSFPLASLHEVCGTADNGDIGGVGGTPSGPVGPSLLGTHTAGCETVFAEKLVVPLHQTLHKFLHNPHDPEKGPVPPTCLHRRPPILAVGGMLYRCQTHEWWTPKGESDQPGAGELAPLWPTARLQVPVSSPHESEQNLTAVSDRSQDLQVSRRGSAPPREVSASAEGWKRRGEENTEKTDLPAPVSSDIQSKQIREWLPQETESSPETLMTPVAVPSLPAGVGDEDEEEVQFCIFSEDEETRKGERDGLHAAQRCPVP